VLLNGPDNPETLPFSRGICTGPHLIHGSLDPLESASNRHLDRFIHFCMAHERDQQTDTPRYSVCSNRPHLDIAVMRSNNTKAFCVRAPTTWNSFSGRYNPYKCKRAEFVRSKLKSNCFVEPSKITSRCHHHQAPLIWRHIYPF